MKRKSTAADWIGRIVLYAFFALLGLFVVLFVIGLLVGPSAHDPLSDSALRQQFDTAEVDVRVARKLFEQGRLKEAEEYLSKAEDKAWRCEQGGVGAPLLSRIKDGAGEIASRHAGFIDDVRRRRARERLSSRAEAMRSALRALEYRNRVWGEVLETVQARVRRQAAGAEASVESPFRVEPGALREALVRRYGKAYLDEMQKSAPGVLERALQDAEALAETPGSR
ncbi:MAG TPA: hypothetical protein DCM05_07455 [Elusimicrobia bacterium]|nr:hypothetical protein [Elusimicrobiota bacterium]